MSLKFNFSALEYIHLVKFSKKPSKFSKRVLSAPFRAFCARKSENLAIEPLPSAQNPAIDTLPSGGIKTPLYLVLGGSKGLGRGLMHPCPRGWGRVRGFPFHFSTTFSLSDFAPHPPGSILNCGGQPER